MANPAGIIMPFAGTVAPQGCLFCDGSAVSRTTYAELFSVIGTTYGAGDGETTFNIPDLSGRVVIGVSNTHAIGSTGGSETVTLTDDQLPSHSHVVPQHGHGNDIAVHTPVLSHNITQQPMYQYSKPQTSTSKTAGGYVYNRGRSRYEATRTTNVAIASHSGNCSVGGSVNPCQAFNSGSFGEGGSHNNMQAYLAVNYIISTGE